MRRKWFKHIMDILFYTFLMVLIIDMMREGDWEWVVTALVGGLAVFVLIERGIDWWVMRKYPPRRCRAMWMGRYQCQGHEGHDGQHSHITLTGVPLTWS